MVETVPKDNAMDDPNKKYVEEILTVFDQIGLQRSIKKDYVQFLSSASAIAIRAHSQSRCGW